MVEPAAIDAAIRQLETLNSRYRTREPAKRPHTLKKVLVANRGEIAKRFFHSLKEEGIPSVALVTTPDMGQSWYATADEALFIGDPANYMSMATVIAAAVLSQANAIYPGYGFLSESAVFVDAITAAAQRLKRQIIFMGPSSEILRHVGNKLSARALAAQYGIPLFPGSEVLRNAEQAATAAEQIGYPVILRLSTGGGAGSEPVLSRKQLPQAIENCRRIAGQLNVEMAFYLERFIADAAHMEVQVFNGTAVGIRKCAVQRRNQKILEESGDVFLSPQLNLSIIAAAEKMAQASGYSAGAGAGTVEFLYDHKTEALGFLDLNARLQVEHPVTDQSLGIDLAKWQILHFDGRTAEVPIEHALRQRFTEKSHAIEARIYAEDPENNYHPVSGTLLELNLPTFNAIRCDFGFGKGDSILPDFDPMLGKIIAKGATRTEALVRLERALSEFYVKGVTTNTQQLLNILRSPDFQDLNYTNNFLADHPELTEYSVQEDGARQAAVFAAVAIELKKNSELARKVVATRDIEGMLQAHDFNPSPEEYIAESGKHQFHLHLLPTTLDNVRVFTNDSYYGDIEVMSRIPENDDYFIRFESRSYHVRIDSRPQYMIVRFPDADGRVNYHRLRLHAQDGKSRSDPPGLVRAPFHGSFVRFCADLVSGADSLRMGSRVQKNQPLLVLSAMKMELTLTAPVDGRIAFLLEDGDLTKLQLGHSSTAQVFGKKIEEGEVLIQIVQEGAPTESVQTAPLPEKPTITGNGTFENLLNDDLINLALENPDAHLPVILEITGLVFDGLVRNEKIISKVAAVLESLTSAVALPNPVLFCEQRLVRIVMRYCRIKTVFSPTQNSAPVVFREFNELLAAFAHREPGAGTTYSPSPAFRGIMNELFLAYDLTDWFPGGGLNSGRAELALMKIFRSYYACGNFQMLVRVILEMLGQIPAPQPFTIRAVRRVVALEEMELDDSLADAALAALAKWGLTAREPKQNWLVHRNYRNEYIRMRRSPGDTPEAQRQMKLTLQTPLPDLVPEHTTPWACDLLHIRQTKLAMDFHITRFHSLSSQILLYGLQDRKNPQLKRYLCVAVIDDLSLNRDGRGNITGCKGMEQAHIRSAAILAAYQDIERREDNWVELLAAGNPVEMDLAGRDPGILNQQFLRDLSWRLFPFFANTGLGKITTTFRAFSRFQPQPEWIHFLNREVSGSPEFSLLPEGDPAYTYADRYADAANTKLFERKKWPAELWAELCFDAGSMREILIPGIDAKTRKHRETGAEEKIPVGSRLFEGNIAGKGACFYIKDSRVRGGATGDLEGMKYIAACYMAFMRGIPLYVFNDGAGANIREGMISLNRAGEGFMLNALVHAETRALDFFSWLDAHADDRLRNLIAEIDGIFAFTRENILPGAFIVAVGIGSSTGLDVYGSSQAAIQCMIDSAESYRVLTGAKVIKSVTGEEISNYDLGGARVMSMATGTTDLVAAGNLELLALLRQIHEVFAPDEPYERRSPAVTVNRPAYVCGTDVAAYTDTRELLEFKKEYRPAPSLTGGFGRLGGRKVLILGPRDEFGLRSAAAMTKACDLVRTARKTGAAQIFLSGSKWYPAENTDAAMHRALVDFMHLMQGQSGPRIHIVLNPAGLNHLPLNWNADAVIAIVSGEAGEKTRGYARKVATHVVATVADAFALAEKIIGLLKSREIADAPHQGLPQIPKNPAEPYDMLQSVIEPVVDAGSFLEYFKAADDRMEGASLITGLARLHGSTVGIIADQPAIIGGAPDAPGTEKFRIFTEFLNRNGIPIVMLSNAPGFIPGKKQERLRIQQIGALSLDTNVLGDGPVVSVVLNQNFGGRQVQAFSKYLRPGIVYIALRKAVMAVMGAQSAFDLFEDEKYRSLLSTDKKAAEKFHADYIRRFNENAAAGVDALATGILDWVFEDAATLRAELIRGLDTARKQTTAWRG